MSQKKDIAKSIIVLTVICLVVSGIMAVVNSFTAPVSAANATARATTARKEIIPAADAFDAVDADRLPAGVSEAYIGKSASGEIRGYVFTASANGFGGAITVMCGIDKDGNIICCKTMDVSSETSTLGGKTADASYTDQYIGRDASLSGVNAISGATITSKAYEACVTSCFEAYETIKEAE